MGKSKRSNYSGYGNRKSNGRDAARNIGVVLILGGLSFFLGFFVLSRMVPDRGEGSGTTGQSNSPSLTEQSASAATLPPQNTPSQASSPPASASVPTDNNRSSVAGPSIEPSDDTRTQSARNIDSTRRERRATAEGDAAANPANPVDTSAHPGNDGLTADGNSTDDTTGSSVTHRKKRRTADSADADQVPAHEPTDNGTINEGDQKPSSIDRDSAGSASRANSRSTSTDAAGNDASKTDASPAKTTRYRVSVGAYTRRETAEREANKVSALGMDVAVVPVTTADGTTVYRVQQGIYKHRANADAARQRLADNGLDADVVKTQ